MDTSKFAELGLNEQILAGVEALGFTDPTPVQKEAIPLVLAGRDVVASAQTGTGKTAAFALPVLQVIEPYSRAARQQDTTSDGDKPADRVQPTSEPAKKNISTASTKDAAEVDGDVNETGTAVDEAADSAEPVANEIASEENHDDVAGDTVLADAMPGDPHISEPVNSNDVTSNNAASSKGSHESSMASPDGHDDSVPEQGANEASGEKPKKPRRRHHKKVAVRVVAEGGTLAGGSHENGSGDSTSTKASESSSDTSSVTADSPVADASPDTSTKPARKHRKHKAKTGVAKEDSGEQPKSASTSKPKRKRRKKHAKKKGSLAAEIDAAVDPNAHPFGPFALVVTPTRELAQQIDDVVSKVCEYTGQRAVIVMGGAKFERQIRDLQKGCDMLVATPGRLIDLMDHNHVDLSQVKVLVLDEADRMLDMGFWPSVRRIVDALPKDRQTLLFSATIPPSIKGTVDAMLHDPAKVEIARIGETADTVDEHLCPVTQGQKIELLEALINRFDPERVLVFCRTKHRVDDVSTYLAKAGFSVDVMHADRSQKERERALAKFRAGKCKILVATDVMSRGIDVSGIDAVVNFDVPMDPEDYVHRIGRTGRAGHKGLAFTFVAPDEISPLREIEYFTKKLIPVWDLEGFDYDDARIVPNPDRSTKRPMRTMFNGARARGRGIGAGRYGRHY